MTAAARVPEATYQDPLDVVWTATAAALGMRIVRDDAAYASWDGAGTLTIGTEAELDPDDCLAQMVLHEVCHAVVEGPEKLAVPDWGLENVDDRDLVREHACHRVQAALADAHGLRGFLAVTTDWRPYWDALPADALADDGDDPAVAPAREAMAALRAGPWWAPLQEALAATAAIAAATRPFAEDGSLWGRVGRPAPGGQAESG